MTVKEGKDSKEGTSSAQPKAKQNDLAPIKAEELSEEDQELRDNLLLMVERLADVDGGV